MKRSRSLILQGAKLSKTRNRLLFKLNGADPILSLKEMFGDESLVARQDTMRSLVNTVRNYCLEMIPCLNELEDLGI
jgi:hypothetical protein